MAEKAASALTCSRVAFAAFEIPPLALLLYLLYGLYRRWDPAMLGIQATKQLQADTFDTLSSWR